MTTANDLTSSSSLTPPYIPDSCFLDLSKYYSDPQKSIDIYTPKSDFIEFDHGIVYKITCPKGYIFENEQRYHKKCRTRRMRCVCKENELGQTLCKKNAVFGRDLGRCISMEYFQNELVFSNQKPIFDLKRLKFSNFMRSLYDTFWFGPGPESTNIVKL